ADKPSHPASGWQMTEAGKVKVLTPSPFCFAIRNCLQIFVTGNKKSPPLIDRITPNHNGKCAF
ncbi:hypothetical protein Q9L26_10565, partial [Salmonella enterica subsp. enterica serovar Brancaster]|uniref:hypothetical protein n=2 Tax=Salmonella enterica TaxID=28901 RepID=UPI0027B4E97D